MASIVVQPYLIHQCKLRVSVTYTYSLLHTHNINVHYSCYSGRASSDSRAHEQSFTTYTKVHIQCYCLRLNALSPRRGSGSLSDRLRDRAIHVEVAAHDGVGLLVGDITFAYDDFYAAVLKRKAPQFTLHLCRKHQTFCIVIQFLKIAQSFTRKSS